MFQTFMDKSYIFTILFGLIFHINLFNITKCLTPCGHILNKNNVNLEIID